MPMWGVIAGSAGLAALALLRARGIPIALGVGAVLMSFRVLEIRVTDEEIEFGFGPIRKRFPVQRVIGCEPYPIRFREFGGIGIRLNTHGDVCYNTRFGEGTRLTIEGGRHYILSVPAAPLCAALARARESGSEPSLS